MVQVDVTRMKEKVLQELVSEWRRRRAVEGSGRIFLVSGGRGGHRQDENAGDQAMRGVRCFKGSVPRNGDICLGISDS